MAAAKQQIMPRMLLFKGIFLTYVYRHRSLHWFASLVERIAVQPI